MTEGRQEFEMTGAAEEGDDTLAHTGSSLGEGTASMPASWNGLRQSSQPLRFLLQGRTTLQNHLGKEKTQRTSLLQQMTSYRHAAGFTPAKMFHRDDAASPEEIAQGGQEHPGALSLGPSPITVFHPKRTWLTLKAARAAHPSLPHPAGRGHG